jgi:hypothetical protein
MSALRRRRSSRCASSLGCGGGLTRNLHIKTKRQTSAALGLCAIVTFLTTCQKTERSKTAAFGSTRARRALRSHSNTNHGLETTRLRRVDVRNE